MRIVRIDRDEFIAKVRENRDNHRAEWTDEEWVTTTAPSIGYRWLGVEMPAAG
ncbi:hypothetical protein [Flexivirga sp.]|uniref:hypothetical protein n=1 Tax=Flexivirga sp. TaxID=1962927 RepID=UPI003F7EFBD3